MKKTFVFLAVFFGALSAARAASFKILGPRPTGMGGAFVAVAEGALATYWNPAGLAFDPGFRMNLPASANIEATGGILDAAKKIADSAKSIESIQTAQKDGKSIGLADLETFSNAIINLNEMAGSGKGLLADVSGGANVRIGRWAVTVNNFSSLGIDPMVDIGGISLGTSTIAAAPLFFSAARLVSAEDIQGIDFSKLKDDYTGLFSTASPGGLESESSSLSGSIETLATAAGAKITGYTPQQIANALINIAASQGISPEQIKDAVRDIDRATTILVDIISGKAFKNNDSNLTIRGLSATEIVFSHGRELPRFEKFPFLKGVAVGANIKYIMAQTAYIRQYILKGETSALGDMSSLLTQNTRQSAALALDLGVLWRRDDWPLKPRAGIVGRNVNSPKFSMPPAAVSDGYGDYTLAAQWRAGVAAKPLNWWLIACDADLSQNETEVAGYDSRNLSFGSELNVVNSPAFNAAFRAGIIKNFAFSSAPLTYTAGFGLNLFGFNMDVAGAMSADKVVVEEGKEIPSRAMASLSLSFNF